MRFFYLDTNHLTWGCEIWDIEKQDVGHKDVNKTYSNTVKTKFKQKILISCICKLLLKFVMGTIKCVVVVCASWMLLRNKFLFTNFIKLTCFGTLQMKGLSS